MASLSFKSINLYFQRFIGSFLSNIASHFVAFAFLMSVIGLGNSVIAKQVSSVKVAAQNKQKSKKSASQPKKNNEVSSKTKSSQTLLDRKNAFDKRTWDKRGFITRTYGSVAVDGGIGMLHNGSERSPIALTMAFDFGIGQEFIIKLPGRHAGLLDLYLAAEFSNRTFINFIAPGNYALYITPGSEYNLCATCASFNYYNNFGVDFKMGVLLNRASGPISKFGFYAFGGIRFNATSNLYESFPSATITPVPTVGVGSMIYFKAVPNDRLRMSFDFFCDAMQPINIRFYGFNTSLGKYDFKTFDDFVVFGLRTAVQYSF